MATLCQPAGRLDQSIINEKRMEHRGKFEIPSAFVSMSRNKSMGGSRERERERERNGEGGREEEEGETVAECFMVCGLFNDTDQNRIFITTGSSLI